MEFDQKMILDATRGSIARFINHSCEPNCEMIKMTVAGKPRMALFAGENGVMTGDELTYDYNFNPYSVKNVQRCRCGAPSCRGVLGPKPKEIRDALKPLTEGGGKRKFQQALEDGIETMTKKRKMNVPTGVKKALSTVKAQTTETLSKARLRKSGDEEQKPLFTSPSKAFLRSSKSTSILEQSIGSPRTRTTVTCSRRHSSAAQVVKEEVDEAEAEERLFNRRSSARATASSVRKNVVRTVKRSGNTAAAGGRQGNKSIRVIEDA